MKLWVISRSLFFQLSNPFVHRRFADIHRSGSGGNSVVLIEHKLGSFEAKLGAKITSVTSGHNVTCFDYEVMISPLFRWPNSLCHYITNPLRSRRVDIASLQDEFIRMLMEFASSYEYLGTLDDAPPHIIPIWYFNDIGDSIKVPE